MSYCINKKLVSLLIASSVLVSCASSSITKRIGLADDIAHKSGMKLEHVKTGGFILTAYSKIQNKNKPVNIYIEGDGFSWASPGRLSVNPTPKDAFTLQLASIDPAENVVYIARPCQYTKIEGDALCAPKYWSGSRFSKTVIDSVNDAINHYSSQFKNPKINLIGYSGGGAVAVLVAARRSDVATLRTVGGNLDHIAVNTYHGVDMLDDSLNPIDVAEKIASLPQYHFIGVNDNIIPLSVVRSFAEKSEHGQGCVKVSSVNGATHDSGWKEHWQEILAQPVLCKTSNNSIIKERIDKHAKHKK